MQGQDTGETEIFQVYKPQTQNRGLRYFATLTLATLDTSMRQAAEQSRITIFQEP